MESQRIAVLRLDDGAATSERRSKTQLTEAFKRRTWIVPMRHLPDPAAPLLIPPYTGSVINCFKYSPYPL